MLSNHYMLCVHFIMSRNAKQPLHVMCPFHNGHITCSGCLVFLDIV